jgi:hypothetical protein
VEKLEKGLGRGLVPVCAPPGFGKTALLAALDPCQPAAGRLAVAGCRHAVAALDRISPGIAGEVTPLIQPRFQPPW